VERREGITCIEIMGQREIGGARGFRWKAAAFSGWHEPYESRGSRTVVCPGKASVFSRRQTCRGRSQSPVVWIAEERKGAADKAAV
jgi:hypothetical protein